MNTDHYKTLGVDKDADAGTIKNAFRARAFETHPDHNPGKEEEFKTLAVAYTVLSDPGARRYYDRTGEDKPVDDTNVQAMSLLVTMLANIRQANADNMDALFQTDLIKKMDDACVKMEADARAAARDIRRTTRTIDRLAEKIKHHGHGSVLHTALAQEKQQNRVRILGLRRDMLVFRRARVLLGEYSFDADPALARSWEPAGMYAFKIDIGSFMKP